MTNIQAEMFLSLSEGQSINSIAERFMLCRTSVSRQLHQIEEELDLTLLSATGSGTRLTLEGATIMPEVKRFSDSVHAVLQAAGQHDSTQKNNTDPVLSTDDLKIILTVNKRLNYSDCSDILHLSEAGISKRILKIEDALGIRLFDRVRGSSIKVRPEASCVFSAVEKAENSYGELLGEAYNLAKNKGKKLVVGVPPHLSNKIENKFLADFCISNPDIELVIVEAFLSELIDRFNSGSLDVILSKKVTSDGLDSTFKDLEDCFTIDMGDCDLHVVLPSCHPLASKKELELYQLKDTRFMIVGNRNNKRSIIHRFVDACRKSGFEPNATSYPRITKGVLLNYVRNYHYATLSLSGPESYYPDIAFIPLKQPFIRSSVVLIIKQGKPLTRAKSRILSFAMDYSDGSIV